MSVVNVTHLKVLKVYEFENLFTAYEDKDSDKLDLIVEKTPDDPPF